MKSIQLNKSILFFDLRSGSVSATYCIFTPKPSVIFSETQHIPFGRISDTFTFIEQSLKTLHAVAESSFMYLIKNNISIPEVINIYYTSPWFESNIIKKTNISDTGHVMTPHVFNEQKEDTFNQLHALAKKDSLTIEVEHLSTMLNGYITDSPINKQYKKSDITSYMSTINRTIHSRIEEVIIRHFPHKKITHYTLPIAVSKALYFIKPQYTGHFVIIHGEATDVCTFKQGKLMSHGSFPHGSHLALKKLSTSPLSKEIYSLIGTKKVLPTKRGAQKDSIYSTYEEWVTFFNKSLDDNAVSTNGTILITSEDSIACTYAKEALIKNNINRTVGILDKGHCIGHGVELNSLSRDMHILSFIEAYSLL